jgi:hypothetical protein
MIVVKAFDSSPFGQQAIDPIAGRFLRTFVRLIFSGNYVAGGDILDFTNANGVNAASAVPQAQSGGLVAMDFMPFATTNAAVSAINGTYKLRTPAVVTTVPIPISQLANLLLKIFLVGGEYGAGAYGADVLADVCIAECFWAR